MKTLDGFVEAMPEFMASVGMKAHAATLLGFMVSYLYGFILLIFPMLFWAATLYFVSENRQEERKQMLPINKCRHSRPPFSIKRAVTSSSPGKPLPAQTSSSPVL